MRKGEVHSGLTEQEIWCRKRFSQKKLEPSPEKKKKMFFLFFLFFFQTKNALEQITGDDVGEKV